ncbi:MAG: hypothetical protein PHD29_00070 [bacterium]|nr:hypothetical protein [bacterium]
MSWDTYTLHFGLALLQFILINIIGKQSYSKGYMELSIFMKADEAPMFNFIYRIFSPVVYIIIISVILYALSMDIYVNSIYLISVYYVAFRLLFNLALGRAKLLDWNKELLCAVIIIFISYFIYRKLIVVRSYLFPDMQTIGNELWLIIIFFLYELFNNIKLSPRDTEKRKSKYIDYKFLSYQHKYKSIIEDKVTNAKLKALIYSIMIYESFNRPKLIRMLEVLLFKVGHSKTLGIMQVKTDRIISDNKSVEIGVNKILYDYNNILKEYENKEDMYKSEYWLEREIIERYNKGNQYANEIQDLVGIVRASYFSNNEDTLLPKDWKKQNVVISNEGQCTI